MTNLLDQRNAHVVSTAPLGKLPDHGGMVTSACVLATLTTRGIFCARTPHKYKYVSLFASLFKNKYHSKILKFIQPQRIELDIFPTVYKLNTQRSIKKNI